MDKIFYLTDHAQSRMESRRISNDKVAQAIFHGQIFAAGQGRYKAKFWEVRGKIVDEYVVVFSKKERLVITVEHNVLRNKGIEEERVSRQKKLKRYKQRKRAIWEEEFDSWCREEYGFYNLPFSA